MKHRIDHRIGDIFLLQSYCIRARYSIVSARPFLNTRGRAFHGSTSLLALKTQKLTDIGEGIAEVQIIQWFVSEGAHVEEWSPLLEVQSDKAADTITSRFAGVVKKLHAKQDDTVPTGSALCDIDVVGDAEETVEVSEGKTNVSEAKEDPALIDDIPESNNTPATVDDTPRGKHTTLATPAVRGMLKEHGIDITEVRGTGKEGRVTKGDVQDHIVSKDAVPASSAVSTQPSTTTLSQIETIQPFTPLQHAMFRTMTHSLQIPHFLFSDDINITSLSALRLRLNTQLAKSSPSTPKLTYLPFIIKALSLSLIHHPILNSRLDTTTSPSKPQLHYRPSHNIGFALDTPTGLLVPVIDSVNTLTIPAVAAEITRLTSLGRAGKLSTSDLTGATISVSNVGSLGGTVVAPVIVEGQVAILGVGKARSVPIFDEDGKLVRAEMCTLSWSADHRVVDGATVARAAARVKKSLEEIGSMVLEMR